MNKILRVDPLDRYNHIIIKIYVQLSGEEKFLINQ